MRISRRAMLAGLAAGAALPLRAEAPLTSPRPLARRFGPERAADIVARARFSGMASFLIADLDTGEILDAVDPDLSRPPASVAKAATAGYALDALGGAHRYVTRVLATGPVEAGVLDGDLILAGGGDPQLQTVHLADLIARLRAAGLREVRGQFLVWDEALKNIDEIDRSQADHLGYNPSISGLNLNFNRVHFEWKLENGDYRVAVDARGGDFVPPVRMSQVSVVDRTSPVYTYRDAGGRDEWTVARSALNDFGSRWLPVRYPALYAGEVFAELARGAGLSLRPPQEVPDLPETTELARLDSDPLSSIVTDMLRYSTNITAEVVGLSATMARSGERKGLRLSAHDMTEWWRAQAGGQPYFADHSGLGDLSRCSAREMVDMLRVEGMAATLHPLLRRLAVTDPQGNAIRGLEEAIRAKTGTLNFVSGLAGYLDRRDGRRLVFASFVADMDARARGKDSGEVQPPGASGFNGRARNLHRDLLREWVG